jgi:tetratricopeptide (TPR) repeat protein
MPPFPASIPTSPAENPHTLFAAALLEEHKGTGDVQALDLLRQAIKLHLAEVGTLRLAPAYYTALDPLFVVSLFREAWSIFQRSNEGRVCVCVCVCLFMPLGTLSTSLTPQICLDVTEVKQSLALDLRHLLDLLTRAVPGNANVLFYHARLKHALGDVGGARELASRCLLLDARNVRVHLLLADIAYAHQDLDGCLSALDMALSIDFEVRFIVRFQLLKAKALKRVGRGEEALKLLASTLTLPGVRTAAMQATSLAHKLAGDFADSPLPGTAERLDVFLELTDSLQAAGQQVGGQGGTPACARLLTFLWAVLLTEVSSHPTHRAPPPRPSAPKRCPRPTRYSRGWRTRGIASSCTAPTWPSAAGRPRRPSTSCAA